MIRLDSLTCVMLLLSPLTCLDEHIYRRVSWITAPGCKARSLHAFPKEMHFYSSVLVVVVKILPYSTGLEP